MLGIVPQGIEAALSGGTASLSGALHPYGPAFITGDGAGGICGGGGLARSNEAGKADETNEKKGFQ